LAGRGGSLGFGLDLDLRTRHFIARGESGLQPGRWAFNYRLLVREKQDQRMDERAETAIDQASERLAGALG
jgi:hypothetical protein